MSSHGSVLGGDALLRPPGVPSGPTSSCDPASTTTVCPEIVLTSTLPSYTTNVQVFATSQATVNTVPRTVATASGVVMENPPEPLSFSTRFHARPTSSVAATSRVPGVSTSFVTVNVVFTSKRVSEPSG